MLKPFIPQRQRPSGSPPVRGGARPATVDDFRDSNAAKATSSNPKTAFAKVNQMRATGWRRDRGRARLARHW